MHRATHEVNNALNAVAMNLEVARLRAVPGADAGWIAPFAAAAAESHEEVVAMVQALMALARGPLDAAGDVREVAAQMVAVLAPGVRAKGGSLVLHGDGQPVRTIAPAAAVRLATAHLLDVTASDPTREWRCTVAAAPVPSLALVGVGTSDRVTSPATSPATSPVLERAGVRPGPVAWSLAFPSP